MRHRLNKTESILSVNKDIFTNFLLKSNKKELIDSKLIKNFSALEREGLERDLCNTYRFIIEIDSEYSNILQNITSDNSLAVLNSERFLSNSLYYEDDKFFFRFNSGVNNSNLGRIKINVSDDNYTYIDNFYEDDNILFEIPINIDVTKIKVSLSSETSNGEDFICWKINDMFDFNKIISDEINEFSEINNYYCYYGNENNKIDNLIYCESDMVVDDNGYPLNTPPTYSLKIKSNLPMVKGALTLNVKIGDIVYIVTIDNLNDESDIFFVTTMDMSDETVDNEIGNIEISMNNDNNNTMYNYIFSDGIVNK